MQPDVTLRLSVWLNRWPLPYTFLILQRGPGIALALPNPSHINPSLGKGGFGSWARHCVSTSFIPPVASKGEAVSPQFTDGAQMEGHVCALVCDRPGG